ncbi:MAG: mandelate racemase/muconate lactonizing enzyme family protein [Ignavibacteriales bacterium]|nr:mandelate racemase/muconate lactonizing enzyme family protein [Ignavibacteriales bacterium]MCB9211048.1 mandelate racemase/muconate lactonizing enzyme family protein [Ignavibacteriales bacterium]MCB9219479.1 mandelate racemase/muconate lactonizing enzyme family protein [Ignavibacteriales bacterium]MCB9259847.1 mandelate racemase/muconate lactonizing enzyme family protein [Ignavibacteriales bacterium]
MSFDRRNFIKTSLGAAILAPTTKIFSSTKYNSAQVSSSVLFKELESIALKPVIKINIIKEPVIVESLELLKTYDHYIVRARSKDGAEGIAFTGKKIIYLYPILLQQVFPVFIGKDARMLEELLDQVYVYDSNYKMQGLAFWCCVAWAEFAILDLLGKTANKHISYFFGERVRDKVPIYTASGNRGTSPEEEVEILQKKMEETGAKAVKFKVGGRMSRNRDAIPNRSEKLIELSRKTLGDEITIQADANGSYDVKNAIEIGKRLEGINAYLFEEPCPFDYLDETKQVADALNIPVSGGEQESSEYRFRQMLAEDIVQILQPDLHYYGGYIRTTRVARMAEHLNVPLTCHISNDNTGYADMANLFSFVPNMGRFQELKTDYEFTAPMFEPPIEIKDGFINIPTGPGNGLVHTEDLIKKATVIKESI